MDLKRTIHRSLLIGTSNISGYYRFSDVFQIYPSEEREHSSRHAFIEYNTKYSVIFKKKKQNRRESKETTEILERKREKRNHLNFLKEITALLNIVTNENFKLDYDKFNSVLPETQEVISDFSDLSNLHEISRRDGVIYQAGRFCDQFVAIHSKADIFFKNYFNLTADERHKCGASAFLYNSAQEIFVKFASMAWVAYASSIENLANFHKERTKEENDICKNCQQPKYKISARFREFVKSYSGTALGYESEKLIKFYSTRSSIVHAGLMLDLDRDQTLFPAEEYSLLAKCSLIARTSFFNYVLTMI